MARGTVIVGRRLLTILVFAIVATGPARAEPVTVENCGRSVTFERPPERAVSQDMNISEIMFALDLRSRMVGVTGITGWYKMTSAFRQAMGSLPELASKNPSVETLVAAGADFYFAGWYYGMQPGGAVTPESLATFGIATYVLSESCAHVGENAPTATMDLLYDDVLNIGRIFGRADRAAALVRSYRTRVDRVRDIIAGNRPPRVFVLDSGEEKPFTAGRAAMPTAIIAAAGGHNVLGDVAMSWGRIGWEAVIARDPEVVIIVGYQDDSWRDRWEFFRNHPALSGITAARRNRFVVLGYTELTPGPNNIPAIEKLARALHPERFP